MTRNRPPGHSGGLPDNARSGATAMLSMTPTKNNTLTCRIISPLAKTSTPTAVPVPLSTGPRQRSHGTPRHKIWDGPRATTLANELAAVPLLQ